MSIIPGIGQSPVRIFRATHAWRFLDVRELWSYRDLLWLLVKRDISVRYKQTALGPLWFILQPLLTSVVFVIVFTVVAKIPTAGVPPMLFYLSAQLGWQYFANSFASTSNTLVNNANLFSKIYFPRLIIPLSTVISNLLAFLIQFATFIIIYAVFKNASGVDQNSFHLQLYELLFLPLLALQIAAVALGVGVFLSALTAKYRDFSVLSTFILQLWMYVTPVIYPLSQVPERFRIFVVFNPMAAPIETIRHILLGTQAPGFSATVLSIAITIVVLIGGIFVFRQIEKTFVDVV